MGTGGDEMKPIRGKLLIDPIGGDYKTPSGIIVVSLAKNLWPRKGKVISVGGKFKDKYYAKKGEIVQIKKNAGQKVTLNHKEYLIIKNDEIVGVE